jgi:hypothetical protein
MIFDFGTWVGHNILLEVLQKLPFRFNGKSMPPGRNYNIASDQRLSRIGCIWLPAFTHLLLALTNARLNDASFTERRTYPPRAGGLPPTSIG